MSPEARWAKLNVGLNLLVIVLLAVVSVQMWGERVDRTDLRREIQVLNERLQKHIATAAGVESRGWAWPRTAGGHGE